MKLSGTFRSTLALSSTLIHVLAHFQRTTCSQIYFRFSSYLLRKPHLFVILTAIGWFIVNIQSDLFWHRCLERQAFGTPRMYTLSPSKSIKGSNYGEFLKDKNVLLCTRLYKYALNLESLFTQQYVCVMCTLWSDNTCVFTRFHSVKYANTQLIWSSGKYKGYLDYKCTTCGKKNWMPMELFTRDYVFVRHNILSNEVICHRTANRKLYVRQRTNIPWYIVQLNLCLF
jgi:hypothetical protein